MRKDGWSTCPGTGLIKLFPAPRGLCHPAPVPADNTRHRRSAGRGDGSLEVAQADAWMPTTGQAAPVASSDASDGAPDRKTPKGGRSRRAQKIPLVESGFRLFLSILSGAKAALHRATATPKRPGGVSARLGAVAGQ
jgi:hypothetical protein